MITAKEVAKKMNEAETVWEVFLQIRNGKKTVPVQKIFKGNITQCVDYLKNAANSAIMKDSSGVLVSDNAIGNVFFKFEAGKVVTSPSPYPGLKFMNANPFQPFK